MFEEKEVDLWKAVLYILVLAIGTIAFGMWLLNSVPTEAATLKGDYAVGGYSYILTKYVENGGNPEECLPDTIKVSNEEREVLYRIVEAEVTDEGNEEYYQAKVNVASCIVVRWQTGWAKSITDVVFQKCGGAYQFSPIKDGRYWSVNVTEQTKKAVDNVLRYGATHDSPYFCTRTCSSYKTGFHSTLQHTFDDCVHAYFK